MLAATTAAPAYAAKKPKVVINKPSAPTITSIISTVPKKNKVNLTITISLPSNNGGSVITGSKVSAKGASCSMTKTKTSCVIKNVKTGKSLNFVSQSKNARGFGSPSATVSYIASGANWAIPLPSVAQAPATVSQPAPQLPSAPAGQTIYGTAGNDILYGTEGNDIIYGLGGDDTIYALGGDDYIEGGDGSDVVYGDDVISANSFTIASVFVAQAKKGKDRIKGGRGNDRLFGGDDADQLEGGEGNDQIDAGEGNDTSSGDSGSDSITSGPGSDESQGGDGDDQISGGTGDDTLSGGNGSDDIDGETGEDNLSGGKGVDNCDVSLSENRDISCDILSALSPYFARTSGQFTNWPSAYTECYLVFADYFWGGSIRAIIPIQTDGSFEYDVPPFANKSAMVMSYGEIYSNGNNNSDPNCPVTIIGTISSGGVATTFNHKATVTKDGVNRFEAELPAVVEITVKTVTSTNEPIPNVSLNCYTSNALTFPHGYTITPANSGFGNFIGSYGRCRGLRTDSNGEIKLVIPQNQNFDLTGKIEILGLTIDLPTQVVVADTSKTVTMIYGG